MPKHIKTADILNKIFGRLTIIEDLGTIDHVRFVMCRCECGKIKKVRLSALRNKNTQSCGCFGREQVLKSLHKHGLTKHKIHDLWSSIKGRCSDKKDKNYYQRGVMMCKEWAEDFMCFYEWCMANGWKLGLQIDKDIKYKEKHGTFPGKIYSPEYCCFVTPKVNGNNREVTLFFEYKGETKCFSDWCELYGLNRKLTHQRMTRDGISFEQLMKDRGKKYERNIYKITAKDAITISNSKLRVSDLAKKYGLAKSTIFGIRSGRTWSKITGIKKYKQQ